MANPKMIVHLHHPIKPGLTSCGRWALSVGLCGHNHAWVENLIDDSDLKYCRACIASGTAWAERGWPRPHSLGEICDVERRMKLVAEELRR